MTHFRIDRSHSNAHTAWQKMGAPQNPNPAERAALHRAGQLELIEPPRFMRPEQGAVTLRFEMPRHGVSLVKLEW